MGVMKDGNGSLQPAEFCWVRGRETRVMYRTENTTVVMGCGIRS